jgi:hypothetical protein
MLTRPKNNYKKVYILKDLCKKDDMYECEVENVKYLDNLIMYRGRIVCGYCACGSGTLQYVPFKDDKEKFFSNYPIE